MFHPSGPACAESRWDISQSPGRVTGGCHRVVMQLRHAGDGHVRIADGLDFFESVSGDDPVKFREVGVQTGE